IDRLEPIAERDLEEVTRLLHDISYNHIKEEVDEMAGRIMRGAKNVFDFVKNIAQLHPAAQIALNLEIQHQENDAHIAVVHATMVKTVFHLRFLQQIPPSEEKTLEQGMRVLFDGMADTIRKFGKFLFAHLHKSKLQEFDERFRKHREDLDYMYKSVAHVQLTTIVDNTAEILRRLRVIDPETQEAERIVRENGGPDKVMQDPALFERVALTFKERATHTMKGVLKAGFDVLLQRHELRYTMKYRTVEAHAANSKALLVHVKDGPHELIDNEILRTLWLRECNPNSIHDPPECSWKGCTSTTTANSTRKGIPSRMTTPGHWNHSAIGDIIDDDGSGHITALELNAFVTSENRRRPEWTNPQWFAFWACGWYNNNAWYYREIDSAMQNLARSIHSATDLAPADSWNTVKDILSSLKPLILVADVEDFSGIIDTPYQLRDIQEQFRQFEEETIQDRLHQFGVHLTDRASIMAVVGDARIELHMMPLLYILTKRLCKLVAKLLGQRYVHDDEICEIEELATSCIAIFVAYDRRLRDLSRGWRFEAKDIAVQVDRYADGLFKKYYTKVRPLTPPVRRHTVHIVLTATPTMVPPTLARPQPWEYHQAYHDLRRCIFGSDVFLPLHLRPVIRTHHSVSP
ncbi:hypothetical protein BC628DRAFT_1315303, partial [Trametes gibbosa]